MNPHTFPKGHFALLMKVNIMAASIEVNEVIKVGGHSKYPSSLAGGISRGFTARYGGSAAKTLFRAFALAIPPATQAKKM